MYYKNNDMTLYYRKYGCAKDVIVILPGWGDTRHTFDFLVSYLAKDYTVYIFDYPGFGKSTFPGEDLTIYHYGIFFQDFLKAKNIKNPIIIGHSFGGRIAILLAGLYKVNCKKIILIDAAGIKPHKGILKLIRQTVYKVLKRLKCLLPNKIRDRYQKWLLKKFSSADYQALPPQMMKTFRNIIQEDLKGYLKSVEAEVLLIWGEYDCDTPLSDGCYMAKKIPDAALICVRKASHYSYLEQPLYVLRIIKQFIK